MTWIKCNSSGNIPCSRSFHTLIPFGGNLLLFGGLSAADKHLGDLHLLDINTMTWQSIECSGMFAPSSRAFHAMTCNNGQIVLFGGSFGLDSKTGHPSRYYNDVWYGQIQ